jgi:environmental stress-induced protein Ves
MNWHFVHLDEVIAAPWRNGGGTTRELLAWPHKDEWAARISVAEIAADGPFSAYPGVTRWFAVLSGAGVELRVGGKARKLDAQSEPLRFDGAAPADCRLVAGATQDFNLMLRGREGRMQRVQGVHARTCRKGSLVALYSHEHESTFLAVEVRIPVPPRTLAWRVLPVDERIEFAAEAALWMEVAP